MTEVEISNPIDPTSKFTDCATTSTNLLAIATASEKLIAFQDCLVEYEQLHTEFKDLVETLGKCEQMATDLENERKSHAEELRIINQDINHLEDMLKSLKNINESKKTTIAQKYLEFRHDLTQLNHFCREANLPEETLAENETMNAKILDEMKSLKEFTSMISLPIPGTMSTPMTPNAALLSLIASGKFPNPFLGAAPPFGPFPSMSGFPPSTSAQTPKRPSNLSLFHDDVSKLKECQACQRKIHRNAPTCLFCKAKNSSKASIKKLKRVDL